MLLCAAAVAHDRFVARSFTSTLWGLSAYYTAQLLIAWGAALAQPKRVPRERAELPGPGTAIA